MTAPGAALLLVWLSLSASCALRHEPVEWEGWWARYELHPFEHGRGWLEIAEDRTFTAQHPGHFEECSGVLTVEERALWLRTIERTDALEREGYQGSRDGFVHTSGSGLELIAPDGTSADFTWTLGSPTAGRLERFDLLAEELWARLDGGACRDLPLGPARAEVWGYGPWDEPFRVRVLADGRVLGSTDFSLGDDHGPCGPPLAAEEHASLLELVREAMPGHPESPAVEGWETLLVSVHFDGDFLRLEIAQDTSLAARLAELGAACEPAP